MIYNIRKSSGEKQRFDLHKFRRSLFKAGATQKTVDSIVRILKKEKPSSTKKIHEITTELLKKQAPPVADRYNLKRALMELGPDGYPFEKYIGQLLEKLGHTVEVNVVISGACVDHEIDVMAQKKGQHCIVECKYHNRTGLKTDVKVALYMQARFEDIRDAWERNPHHAKELHNVWIVTNTKFTSEAIKYALCKKMKMLSWDYPANASLAKLIEKYDLFPITTLTSLTKHQKRAFLKSGFVLCKDAPKQKEKLKKLGLKPAQIEKIIKESQAVCKLEPRSEQ